MIRNLTMMDFLLSPTIRGLYVVLMLVVILSKFSTAVSQNGNHFRTCIGNGGFDDSCPTGMYCDSNIGGTCLNCSTCYRSSFSAKLIPLKCQCDSKFTGSSAICESIPTSEQIGDPIESEEDVMQSIPYTIFNDFKGYFDGSAASGLQCPELTTSSSELTTYDPQITPYLPIPPVQDHSSNSTNASGIAERCMDPGDPQNGYKKMSNLSTATMIEFVCNKGYVLQGNRSIFCMEDGKWSDKIPTCVEVKEPISCKNPGSPINGFQIQKDYRLHGNVTFDCNRSYRLEGPSHIQCTSLGWSDSIPQCVKTWKDNIMWMVVWLVVAVLGAMAFILMVICCCRLKRHRGSIDCTAGGRSDAETPASDERVNVTEDPSEKYHMLTESSESNSEEAAGSSSSGTRSGSVTPENTSAVYLTDEDSQEETSAISSIKQSIELELVYSLENCSQKLTEVAWTSMQSSLENLLGDREFRIVFLRQLFSGTSLSEGSVLRLSSLELGQQLFLAVREQTEIHDVDIFMNMQRIFTDNQLRSKYPATCENMKQLVQLLSHAHPSSCGCLPHPTVTATTV